MIASATRIGAELAVRDEVDRRLEMARVLTVGSRPEFPE